MGARTTGKRLIYWAVMRAGAVLEFCKTQKIAVARAARYPRSYVRLVVVSWLEEGPRD